MNALRSLALLLICALAGCTAVTVPPAALHDATADTSTQRILITARQQVSLALPQLGDPSAFYLRRRGYGPLPDVNRSLDQIAHDYDIRRVDGWFISSIGQYCEVYELRAGQSLIDMVERISRDARVEIVQPMNYFETQGVRYDDPLAKMQPALSMLAIDSAHEFATGRGVTVAVIDSTVDRRHQELRGRVRSQINLVDQRSNSDAEVHGTAVAGVIGSAANNGAGIVGIAPDAAIASLRACWTVDADTGRAQCSSFSLAQALETAIRMQADVVNMSLAGPEDQLLGELIDAALESGIVVVSAVPDTMQPNEHFPSSHSAVIAVAASDAPPPAVTANLLLAPGNEVMSTTPNDGYAFFSGSSMSAAYVAGVTALMRERMPGIAPAHVLHVLSDTATGRSINACRALAVTEGETRSC